MIKQLFSYRGWADIGTTNEQFYGCTLKVPIGGHKVGDVIPVINIDITLGRLTICDPETTKPMSEYPLLLTVGAQNG